MLQKFKSVLFGIACGAAGISYERYQVKTLFAASPIPDEETSLIEQTSFDTLVTGKAQKIMRFGYPSVDTLKTMDDYILSYDRRTRTPFWVFEHLTKSKLSNKTKISRKNFEFHEDQSIHKFFRATVEDYRRSGYDRGHLAAAANHKMSETDYKQTFLLTNIAPQIGKGFNRDSWNNLEQYVRSLTEYYTNVYVCSGPLYLPKMESDGKNYIKYEVIGKNHVAVPTHFFKVIVNETSNHEFDMEAYVLPNMAIDKKTPLKSFQVPVESIERAAGFLLFEKIPKSSFRRIN